MLDDRWAELAPSVFPWMSTSSEAQQEFSEWSYSAYEASGGARATRAAYRGDVARDTARIMLVRRGSVPAGGRPISGDPAGDDEGAAADDAAAVLVAPSN